MGKKTSILFITNSFGDDTIEYMPQIAKSLGLDIEVNNLYYGGCSIDQHIDYLTNDKPLYEYRYYENGEWKTLPDSMSRPYIKSKKWDYIVLQQASHYSGVKNGLDHLDVLVSLVKELLVDKDTKFIWNMTWTYQSNTWHPAYKDNYESSKQVMFDGIVNNVKKDILNNPSFLKVIPNGLVINELSKLVGEELLYRDTFHLSLEVGRFLAGLTAIDTLFDVDVSKNKFLPNGVDEKLYSNIIQAVNSGKNELKKIKGE